MKESTPVSVEQQLAMMQKNIERLEQKAEGYGRKRSNLLRALPLFVFVMASVAVWFAHAQQNMIVYSGYLEEAGKPVNGKRKVTLSIWDVDKNGTTGTGGACANQYNCKCSTTYNEVIFVRGRFKIALNAGCTLITRQYSSLWVQVQAYAADGKSSQTLARTSMGVVPHGENRIPPGTVIAFAGPLKTKTVNSKKVPIPPKGWLYCDGSYHEVDQYTALYQALLTPGTTSSHYGDSTHTTTKKKLFRVPELRGYFLRGVTHPDFTGGQRDPDFLTRSWPQGSGAISGNYKTYPVGSWQLKATARPTTTGFKTEVKSHSHKHQSPLSVRSGWCFGGSGFQSTGCDNSVNKNHNFVRWDYQNLTHSDPNLQYNISVGGDSETRPTNTYVHYLIKY